MFSKTILALIVAALVAGLSGAASAALDSNWVVQLRATDLNNDNGLLATQFGTAAEHWRTSRRGRMTVQMWRYTARAQSRWSKDVKVAQPANVKMTWDLRIVAGADYAGAKFRLQVWNPSGTSYDIDRQLDHRPRQRLPRAYI